MIQNPKDKGKNMKKLYYEDCNLQMFSATVTGCEPEGQRWRVTLDQTAFYPEGGGQACDVGMLGEAKVLDVQEMGEEVCHFCDRPLPVGATVQGKIDWQRRFDLMQQHTGEHLLSGVIHRLFGYHNSGFHVGAEVMEVDFDGPIPTEMLAAIEEQANELVWADIPVSCTYPAPEELPKIAYRTKRELPWPVRIVDIPGGDTCACCGIHVARTGQVGLIKIISCVKFHAGVRLELVCGQRAYRYVSRIFEENRQISQQLSAPMTQTAQAVQKLNQSYAAEKYRTTGLQKQLFSAIAETYRGAGNVLHFQPELTGGAVRELADAIANRCGGVAAVCSGEDNNGYNICLVSRETSVRELGAAAMQALNGRGGGRDPAFQGTVKSTRLEVEKFFLTHKLWN